MYVDMTAMSAASGKGKLSIEILDRDIGPMGDSFGLLHHYRHSRRSGGCSVYHIKCGTFLHSISRRCGAEKEEGNYKRDYSFQG